MRVLIRYGIITLAITLVVILAIWPFATAFVNQWAQRDIELRSQMLFNAARDQVLSLQGPEDGERLAFLLERLSAEEAVFAVGLCEAGDLRVASTGVPEGFSCNDIAIGAGEVFTRVDYAQSRALVAAYPLSAPEDDVRLVILHDYADVEERREQARLYIVLAAIGVAFGGAALASLVAFWIMRRWTMSVRRAIEDAREGRAEDVKHTPTEIGSEIRQALSELDFARRTIDTVHTEWNPETLRIALANELPGSEVIVVSNREPYIHNRDENGGLKVQRPASGLVSALEPVTRACGGTWIAHGSGTGDREAVDNHDRVMVPPSNPSYTLRRIWLSDEEQDGYYYGFANEGLWPLCHIAFVRPVFREADWR
ncbi:MAG: trehalose-6-phosphate synthase, partial [Salinarimonas sp.]